jgi:beta-glucanase (GH16 family)
MLPKGVKLVVAAASPESPKKTEKGRLITWNPSLAQEMVSHDSPRWRKANWSNGGVFNNTWQPDNVIFKNGIMSLVLDNKGCPSGCDGKPYASGEYRSKQEIFSEGYYEARMKAAKGNGLVSSFFTYTGEFGKSSHYEIDYEILGKNCGAVQTNYYPAGQKGNEQMINLPFNACEEFHNYGFKVTKENITWYIDGNNVRKVSLNKPFKPARIMVNFWPGIGVDGWLGSFKYPGRPLQAQYDWIRYSPLTKKTAIRTPQPAERPSEAPPTRIRPVQLPTDAIYVKNVERSHEAWKGGNVTLRNGRYLFTASEANDPGFKINLGDLDVSGKKVLKFKVSGTIQKQGNYARFTAQIYDRGVKGTDDDTPSISHESVPVSPTGAEVEFSLELPSGGYIQKVWKVQFMLVTDNGSCNVRISELRFE